MDEQLRELVELLNTAPPGHTWSNDDFTRFIIKAWKSAKRLGRLEAMRETGVMFSEYVGGAIADMEREMEADKQNERRERGDI
jgi:hypothetical protein